MVIQITPANLPIRHNLHCNEDAETLVKQIAVVEVLRAGCAVESFALYAKKRAWTLRASRDSLLRQMIQ